MTNLTVDLQIACEADNLPSDASFEAWIEAVLQHLSCSTETELTVRIVDAEEGLALNHQYRGKAYATNVLSFPFEAPVPLPVNLLGDLVICAAVVADEAKAQNKPLVAHWAHMVVHGTLHLLGYDHINNDEAEHMEQLEKDILAALGYADPYADDHADDQH
ncbi:rRNA maturation RNase YbeY [Pseudidiomarina gelatinasegens]|uniref:Endoribonuclease YbeY n=1 Tax=Pseudidiomarina gelatinasegens TaxID=2487740 RepID=A0A443Z723_9GAMM|nr:rRNA maturation RNase YbeY [Pseudidiomarina gelatinasegens]RWU12733.1 rRNA maturation RNase YbeY [Pseudidiomarina gelatinasegens]|tara:strand:- start:942 stop:1424 length:483 start_codon:yes stop_codon:yes gene_type:complete